MIRIEIIANQSVQEEIIKNLEAVMPDFCYSLLPLIYGRGKESYKLGTTTWPETNFILLAYTDKLYDPKDTITYKFKEK